jgi:hypothetical protein
MTLIDMTVHKENQARAVERLKEKGVVLPTFAELRQPEQIPTAVTDQLKEVGLWEINPLNLFRISWKNEPFGTGGRYGQVNYRPGQLPGDAPTPDRCKGPHLSLGGQMVSHRCP